VCKKLQILTASLWFCCSYSKCFIRNDILPRHVPVLNISLQFSTLNINTHKSHNIGESRIPQINSVKGRAVDCLLKTAVDGGCYRHCALCTVCRLKEKLCCVADRQLLFGKNYGQLSHLKSFFEGNAELSQYICRL